MSEFLEPISNFLNSGGVVLYLLFTLSFGIFSLFFERVYFLLFQYKKELETILNRDREFQNLKRAEKVALKESLASELNYKLSKNIKTIEVFISIAPLLGLLGTTIGMVELFEGLKLSGDSSAKSISEDISLATVPTMAGMSIALLSLIVSNRLKSLIERKRFELSLKLKENCEKI